MTKADAPAIAIIGMSGRFPGAPDLDAFWRNLRDGVESITVFSDEELQAAGVSPALLALPHYVKAKAIMDDVELFDAAFFGYTPREAEIMDPQQRLFLECAVAALEHAGYDPQIYQGLIGVYAGVGISSYLLFNLATNDDVLALAGFQQLMIGNEKDHLPTRVSYKLNLTGPSVNVNTTCSTGLVAVHLACQSLLNGECDMALAGGVSFVVPQRVGQLYQEGSIYSPDGHCRAFDAEAQGIVVGGGMGIVVLKRLEDALAEGATIHALISGSAINNDGALKAGYTAPSVQGQAKAIAEAQAMALVEPDTISYVEAHGTATPLGDPVEIAALTQVFRAHSERKGFCAIGSVKTNIGHAGAAAGIAGLLKTVLALKHRQLPPSLHFHTPNPRIDFANSPFYVSDRLTDWAATGSPRRAGVSSFGIGGTNAHVVLEEAPVLPASGPSRPWQLLLLSAKSGTALEAATTNLVRSLRQHPDDSLADIAHTLRVGRTALQHRRMLVCRDRADALAALETRNPDRVSTYAQQPRSRPIIFMFPGQGAQYVQMAAGLYEAEPVFRKYVDRCAALLMPHLGLDLREMLYPPEGSGISDQGSGGMRDTDWQARPPTPDPRPLALDQTQYAQPALFVIEYALARLWMSWGVRPEAMIGHSVGEYVAACLAGVFSLADALALVALRGRLMQQLPSGAMLSVPLPEDELRPLLGEALDLAAVNAPALCVASGPAEAIADLHDRLAERGLETRRLRTSHAFHSAMLDPILEPFAAQIGTVALKPPKIPYISNLSGSWTSAAEATDPGYWARHLRQTVRFSDGVRLLLAEPDRVFLDAGPGRTLGTSVLQHPEAARHVVLPSLRHPRDQQDDNAFLLTTLGKLWLAGVPIDWAGFTAHERRRRLPLPTYPFERRRYWIEPKGRALTPSDPQEAPAIWMTEEPDGDGLAAHPRPNLLSEYVAPTNQIERRVVDIWQELLGIGQIGIYDNFFELGGHSLMATQLLSRLREAFPVEVPLRSLFEMPTAAKLAGVIAEKLIDEIASLSDEEVRMLL
jgi:acyl transferase domain-containing protein